MVVRPERLGLGIMKEATQLRANKEIEAVSEYVGVSACQGGDAVCVVGMGVCVPQDPHAHISHLSTPHHHQQKQTHQDLHGKELEPLDEEEDGGRGGRRRRGQQQGRDIVSIAEQLAKEEANWKRGESVQVLVVCYFGGWGRGTIDTTTTIHKHPMTIQS